MTDTRWNFTREGRVAGEGGEIWYGVAGDPDKAATPLIVIHGGPGMSHDYLYPLMDLADERPVVFYDQLDAGKSDRPNDPANWRVPRFLSEIDRLRSELGLDRIVVFGNSWGGTLAAAYGASRPSGLEKLILSSPLIHTETWIRDNAEYRDALPEKVRQVMDECEARGDMASQAYLDAVDVFYRRHLCRADPWPDYVLDSFATLNETCYAGMWGPNEFTCNGVLRGYDGTGGLGSIDVPTLVTCGEFDEATPKSCRKFADLIPDARLEAFESASHLAFVERRDDYIDAVRRFIEYGA